MRKVGRRIVSLLALAGSLGPLPCAALAAGNGPDPERPPAEWISEVQANIAREEYNVSWQDETKLPDPSATWQAPNRAHDLRTYFTTDGIRVIRRTETEPTWEWSLSLLRVGRPGALREVGPAVLSTYENRVDYERRGDVDLLEWYVNDSRGLEQGFTIPRRPDGSGDRLYIDIAVGGTLHSVLAKDGQSFDFQTSGGHRLIHYGHLKVTDDTGQVLNSWMEGFSGSGVSGIRLVIEDLDARYPLDVDPLATSPAWEVSGDRADARFGYSVAAIGDVNGDGYGDVAIGAPGYDAGSPEDGAVFFYHGSASGLPTNLYYASWGVNEEQMGFSVAAAGDLDGDGYSDVVVGAPYRKCGSPPFYDICGCFYVFYGDETPTWYGYEYKPYQIDAMVGYQVSSAGDVNGDGYSDIIVGAPAKSEALVYHGGPDDLTLAWWDQKQWGEDSAEYNYGRAVALAGDVNGDGYSDVIIGYPENSYVYVYHGSAGGLSPGEEHDWYEIGSGDFGYSVATAGDIDGDGYSDVVIGAPSYSGGLDGEGAAFTYHGSTSGLASNPAARREGEQTAAYFGNSVATAGDVNGDGYSDVIVGAFEYDNGEYNEGQAYVYLGTAAGIQTAPHWSTDSDQAGARYGRQVATAGDVNGDGFSDVMVGAPWCDDAHVDAGRAYVYHGSAAGLASDDVWLGQSNQADARLGHSVASAGDINRDGYDDVIVGVPRFDNGQVDEGRFYVYFGNENGVDFSWTSYREGGQDGAYLGDAVAGAGDIDGDGHDDIIVGAPGRDYPEANEGRVFVYLGGPSGISIHWRGESNVEYAYFGDAVAGAGDVNGDGYADIIVGAPSMDAPTNAEGAAYVWLGSAAGLGPNGTPANADWSAESNQEYGNMGYSVASAGDVNGDGYSDVIVGCIYCDGGQADEGSVFVWKGSPTGLGADGHPGNADWSAEWDQAGAHLGRSVAGAGDVNGDGYSDVIVGATGWDNVAHGTESSGRVGIYHGSAGGLGSDLEFVWNCSQEGEYCGQSVAGVGDVNGDGYADVAFGAPYFDGDHQGEGRVVALLGSAMGVTNRTALHFRGGQEGARMGHAVASAGDVNADGYADMIAGAPYRDNGQVDEGVAFVYLGNEGRSRSVLPQQRDTNLIPIARLGKSNEIDAVHLRMVGHGLLGRGLVRMEREIEPLDEPLNGSGLRVPAEYVDSGLGGTDLGFTQERLRSNDVYHWRVRAGQHPTTSPFQLWGRWLTEPWGGYGEAQFRLWYDSDGDGFDDSVDNCPDVGNPGQADGDADAVGDACDNCPYASNPGQEDADADGEGNACDACTDTDGDGYGSGLPAETCPLDNCPGTYNDDQTDTDDDGTGDACDECTDSDGDGYGDPDFPANTCSRDNCPFVYNPGQENHDGDSMGDACDTDDDNDGVDDGSDNCPLVSNGDQADADDDGIGDACDPCTDSDGDGYGDPGFSANTCPEDNCPLVSNPGQENHDGDSMGDACDEDDDGDGWEDTSDCLPLDETTWSKPSDPLDLRISKSATDNLAWTAPAEPGTSDTLYYDVLTSRNPNDWSIFEAECVESDDTDTVATETSDPLQGEVFHYLVRSQNPCGANMGRDSSGAARSGRACP